MGQETGSGPCCGLKSQASIQCLWKVCPHRESVRTDSPTSKSPKQTMQLPGGRDGGWNGGGQDGMR